MNLIVFWKWCFGTVLNFWRLGGYRLRAVKFLVSRREIVQQSILYFTQTSAVDSEIDSLDTGLTCIQRLY